MLTSNEVNAYIERSERPKQLFCVSNSSGFVREYVLFDFFRQEDRLNPINSISAVS